jgi:hypothetical protein
VLVFLDPDGVGARAAERLRALGSEVITVKVGPAFSGDPPTGYTLDPGEACHYASLFADLEARRTRPDSVLHLWSLPALDPAAPVAERFQRASDLSFYSLLHLGATRPEGSLRTMAVSSGLHEVIGGETLEPEKAPLLALCRVLGQEQPDLEVSSIDVEAAEDPEALAEAIVSELQREESEPVVALRRGRRWVQEFEPIRPPSRSGRAPFGAAST